jgi:hypothetical protein
MPLHQPLDDAEGIILIVDGEARRPLHQRRGGAHHARADRVKRSHPHAGRATPEQALDAISHLAGGLVRERHGENLVGRHAVHVDQPSDARGEHARLAGSRAGEHENRAVDVQDCIPLRRVQPGQHFCVGHGRHHRSIMSKIAPSSLCTRINLPP